MDKQYFIKFHENERMYYSECSKGYVLRLESGEEMQEALCQFAANLELKGAFYQGIGTLSNVELAFYRLNERRYERKLFLHDYEIISLMGNISQGADALLAHSHVCLGDSSFNTISGHLVHGIVSLTAEILITPVDISLTRKEDPVLQFKALISQNRSKLKMRF